MRLIKNIFKIFSGIKIQKQLIFIFLTAIFIPVIILGSYLIFNSRSQLMEHYKDQCHADNLRVKSILLDLTSDIYNRAVELGRDRELVSLLSTEYSTHEAGNAALENYDGFDHLLSQNTAIQKISVYTFNQSLPESKYIHKISDEISETDWFHHASASVTPFWTEELSEDDFHNQTLTLCLHTRIFLPSIKNYAVLNLTVSNNHIKNRIENHSLCTVLWLNNADILYTGNRQQIKNTLLEHFDASDSYFLGTIRLPEQKITGCISTLTTIYSKDCFYVASLDYNSYSYMNKITRINIVMLVCILAGVSLFVYIYSHYFSRRVITLRETMHEASRGNYNISDTFQGKDEISEAFADLNVMIQNILKQEASVYEAEIKAKELINQQQRMEFKMLASQINPHFLYNTLETIRMRSLKAGNRDVANAVKLLGKAMRYVLENTAISFTSLSRELNYIETWLAIQRLRFHDRVNYALKVPDGLNLNEYQIMPLLLQPIVENALLHGLEDVEQNGWIIIHVLCDGEKLHIKIFDNGRGMTPDEITQMKANICHHPKESSKSIGLYNIYNRIRLCHGYGYGLDVKSKKNAGTLFTVTLPASKYKGGDTKNETFYS